VTLEEIMSPFVSTIDIARPPAEVFAYATDPTRFPTWQRDVVRVETAEGGRFVTTRRIGRMERTLTQEITASAAPVRWAARGVDGPVRPIASITVEPIDGGAGSRVTFALDFEVHGIGVALLPLLRRQTRGGAPVSYRNLKRLLESSSAENA
jgi:uncharacterized protein YndB with AHSA1/START domain